MSGDLYPNDILRLSHELTVEDRFSLFRLEKTYKTKFKSLTRMPFCWLLTQLHYSQPSDDKVFVIIDIGKLFCLMYMTKVVRY